MTIADTERVLAVLALEEDLIDPVDAVLLIRDARAAGADVLEHAIRRGKLSETQVIAAIATELDFQAVDLFSANSTLTSDSALLDRCDIEWLERLVAIPMLDAFGGVTVVAGDPTDPGLGDYMAKVFPEGFKLALAPAAQIRQVLLAELTQARASVIEAEAAPVDFVEVTTDLGARGPVPDWIDTALVSAVAQRASDMHFEIGVDGRMLYRLRIDGTLVPQQMALTGREGEVIAALMSRTSTMNSSNIREPQDGSFSFTASGRRIDARVSMTPLITGPKLVIRLLDPANLLSLEDLGYGVRATSLLRRAGDRQQGLIVIAGPTGSGKTTTLYALLQEKASLEKNVMTIEDPVEYRIPLVSQIPVRGGRGDRSVTFDRALQAILRQDPDIILVGEIRNGETARTALEASLTGHLVLTTIHANSAPGVYTRLIELGAPAYLVAEAVTLSASQRLLRRLHTCRVLEPITDEERSQLERHGVTAPDEVAVAVGCAACGHRGFRGRVAVATLSAPDARTRELIARSAPLSEVEAAARQAPEYIDIVDDVSKLLAAGETTVAEALRALTLGDM